MTSTSLWQFIKFWLLTPTRYLVKHMIPIWWSLLNLTSYWHCTSSHSPPYWPLENKWIGYYCYDYKSIYSLWYEPRSEQYQITLYIHNNQSVVYNVIYWYHNNLVILQCYNKGLPYCSTKYIHCIYWLNASLWIIAVLDYHHNGILKLFV